MATRDLERIRFTTRHFYDLQGLRYWVPLGLIVLGAGGAMVVASWPVRVLLALMLPGALLLKAGATRYYRKTFGEVEPQLIDIADLYPIPIFSPAGTTQRLGGIHPGAPIARRFLTTATLTMILFSIFQAIPPNFVVQGHEGLRQHPLVTSQPPGSSDPPWIVGRHSPQPYLLFEPPWIAWLHIGVPARRPPSTLWAVFAQAVYVLCGSLFFGIWRWRQGRRSQSPYLALSILLLGLAALGTSLGFVARENGNIPPILDFFLPALVYPGVALLLCGSSLVLAGLFDHWQLVHALGQPPTSGQEVGR